MCKTRKLGKSILLRHLLSQSNDSVLLGGKNQPHLPERSNSYSLEELHVPLKEPQCSPGMQDLTLPQGHLGKVIEP